MWVLMGMQESEKGYGVYNDNSVIIYRDIAGNDPELCAEIGYREAARRLAYFMDNPSYSLDFYRKKLTNQWCDPVYSVFIMTRSLAETAHPYVIDAYYGQLHRKLEVFLNRYQFLVYFGFAVCSLLLLIKRPPITSCLPFIAVIGGFLFSLLWEAKPRYVIPHVFLMLPAASMGIRSLQLLPGKIVCLIKARKGDTEPDDK